MGVLVDFYVSNDRHHVAMMLPVARRLNESARHRTRIISLCEFRGVPTPVDRFRTDAIEVVRIQERPRRISPPVGRGRTAWMARILRAGARSLAWQHSIGQRVAATLGPGPRLAVLPNDAAFPFDRIADLLRARGTPFVLVQEGIRFPLPAEERARAYGSGGAAAVAAWGEASAEYFRGAGVEAPRIFLTGSPRFDLLRPAEWDAQGAAWRVRRGVSGPCLLLLSNPIDDLGYCSTGEKLNLIRRFVAGLAPVLRRGELTLVVRLHPSESEKAVREVLAPLGLGSRVSFAGDAPLYALLALADGAVVLASTVGLEALLFGVPLGVLEVPGAGFVHDYVSRGAALPLAVSGPIPERVLELISVWKTRSDTAVGAYLAYHLAERNDATGRVVDMLVSGIDGR